MKQLIKWLKLVCYLTHLYIIAIINYYKPRLIWIFSNFLFLFLFLNDMSLAFIPNSTSKIVKLLLLLP